MLRAKASPAATLLWLLLKARAASRPPTTAPANHTIGTSRTISGGKGSALRYKSQGPQHSGTQHQEQGAHTVRHLITDVAPFRLPRPSENHGMQGEPIHRWLRRPNRATGRLRLVQVYQRSSSSGKQPASFILPPVEIGFEPGRNASAVGELSFARRCSSFCRRFCGHEIAGSNI